MSKYKKYITYLQKVTTVGVVTCSKDSQEAMAEALRTIDSKNEPARCFYDETEFKVSDVEEWNPDIDIVSVDPSANGKSINYCMNINANMTQYVAKSCGKSISDIKDEDCEKFFIDCMNEFVAKGEKKGLI